MQGVRTYFEMWINVPKRNNSTAHWDVFCKLFAILFKPRLWQENKEIYKSRSSSLQFTHDYIRNVRHCLESNAHWSPADSNGEYHPTPNVFINGYLLYNGWPCICGCQGSFYHGHGSILTLWSWLNDEKQLFWCKFSYVNNHLYSVINFNHVKLKYIEPCNFLTKRAFVRQQSTLVVAKDPNILHYLNSLIYLSTSILPII